MRPGQLAGAGAVACLSVSLSSACSDWLGIEGPAGHLADASTMDGNGEETGGVDSASGEAEGASSGDAGTDAGVADGEGSDGAEGDAPACTSSASGWSPSSNAGLVLWLDAARGINGPPGSAVASWLDQSPLHNDASQTKAAYQPTLEVSDIGGLPALQFDGLQTFMQAQDNPSLQWGTSDFVVAVVARFSITMGNTDQSLFQKATATTPYSGVSLFVNPSRPTSDTRMAAEVSANNYALSARDGLNDAPHLYVARRAGTLLEARVDGVSAGQALVSPLVDVSAPGQNLMLGQNGYRTDPGLEALQGEIAEIVAISGAVSASDLSSLECYLISKYRL